MASSLTTLLVTFALFTQGFPNALEPVKNKALENESAKSKLAVGVDPSTEYCDGLVGMVFRYFSVLKLLTTS